MSNSNVIAEFLTVIGYKVDTTGANRVVEAQKKVERELVASDKRRTEGWTREEAKRATVEARARGERQKGFAAIHEDLKKHAEAERKVHEQSARTMAERGLAEAKTLKERFQWRRRLDAMDQQAQRAREKSDRAAQRVVDKEHSEQQRALTLREKEFYARRQAMVSGFSQSVLGTLTALGVATTASGLVRGFENMAGGLERLYHAAARTGASAGGLRSFGYAASQAGSTADSAVGSLEALASKMRRSPGYETMLRDLGVAKKDAKGNDIPMERRALNLGKVFAKQPEHQALAYGDALGISEQDVLALRSGEVEKRFEEGERMRARAGLNTQKAAESGKAFMEMYRRLGETVTIIGEKIEGALAGPFGKKVEQFTTYLLDNAEPIAKAVIRIGETMLRLATSAVDLVKSFNDLSPGTKELVLQLGALAAALIIFTSGPLTALAGLAAGIVLLYDDYVKWKNGSRDGFIDWGTWAPAIKNALDACQKLAEWFGNVAKSLTGEDGLTVAFELLAGVLALKVLAPLTKVVGLIGTLNGMKPAPWLLSLLGVTAVGGAAAVANSQGILDAGEGSRSWHERLIRTLEPRFADGIYGQTEKTKAADAKDGRTLWQRVMPKALGGKDAPAAGGATTSGETAPRGDGSGNTGSAKTGQMMSWAMDQLRREGVPEDQLKQAAAHLVGQAQMESGLNPNLVHDQGTGFGIYGARLGRRDKMLAWLKANGYARNSAEGQMRYMAKEAMGGGYPRTKRVLMGQGTGNVEADTTTITGEFEAPRVINRRSGAVQNAMRVGPQGDGGAERPGQAPAASAAAPSEGGPAKVLVPESIGGPKGGVGPKSELFTKKPAANPDYAAYRREMEERAARGELPAENETDAERFAAWKKGRASAPGGSAISKTEDLGNGLVKIVPKGKGPPIIGSKPQAGIPAWRKDAESAAAAFRAKFDSSLGGIGLVGGAQQRAPLGIGGNTDNSRTTSIKGGDTNITVHSQGDARDVAEHTGRVMRNRDADLLRNMKSSFA